METNYSLVTKDVFSNEVLLYASYELLNKIISKVTDEAHINGKIELNVSG